MLEKESYSLRSVIIPTHHVVTVECFCRVLFLFVCLFHFFYKGCTKRKPVFLLYVIYTLLKKLCRVKGENHKRCDTMGFWEGGTDKLETRIRLLIFNIFSLLRTFQITVSHLVLSCVIKRYTLYFNRRTFLYVPENQRLVSFIVYAFATTFIKLRIYLTGTLAFYLSRFPLDREQSQTVIPAMSKSTRELRLSDSCHAAVFLLASFSLRERWTGFSLVTVACRDYRLMGNTVAFGAI